MVEFTSFPSIAALRELVAAEIGEEQLDFYQMQALANPHEPWLECFRYSAKYIRNNKLPNIGKTQSSLPQQQVNAHKNDGNTDMQDEDESIKKPINKRTYPQHQVDAHKVDNNTDVQDEDESAKKPINKRTYKRRAITIRTVEDLKQFILRQGSEYGAQSTFWADSFAQKVIADLLHLTILFVDMERDRNCWPYRVLVKGIVHNRIDSPNLESKSNNNDEEKSSLRYIVVQRQGRGHFTLMSYQELPNSEKVRCFKEGNVPPLVSALWNVS